MTSTIPFFSDDAFRCGMAQVAFFDIAVTLWQAEIVSCGPRLAKKRPRAAEDAALVAAHQHHRELAQRKAGHERVLATVMAMLGQVYGVETDTETLFVAATPVLPSRLCFADATRLVCLQSAAVRSMKFSGVDFNGGRTATLAFVARAFAKEFCFQQCRGVDWRLLVPFASRLTVLEVADCQITAGDLSDLLGACDGKLRTLSVAGCSALLWTDEEWRSVTDALCVMFTRNPLKTVYLIGNAMPADCTLDVCAALSSIATLRTFSCFSQFLKADAVAALRIALAPQPQLRKLGFCCNDAAADGDLAALLRGHPHLRSLVVTCSSSLTRSLDALGTLKNLNQLTIVNDGFLLESWAALGAALGNMKLLTRLCLGTLRMPALMALAIGPDGEATFGALRHSLTQVTAMGCPADVLSALRCFAPFASVEAGNDTFE
jgi:hypothetical protein